MATNWSKARGKVVQLQISNEVDCENGLIYW